MAKGLCDDPEKKREGDTMTEQDAMMKQLEKKIDWLAYMSVIKLFFLAAILICEMTR